MAYRNFTDPALLQQYLNQNFAQPVDTGMPVQNKLYQQPYNMFNVAGEGITSIPITPLDLSDLPVNMGVANEEDEEQVESLVEEEPSGIQKLIKTAMRFAIPGLSFLENIAGGGQPYQQFSPGTTIRNGIVSVAGVNTPYSMFGGDFYNQNTGLNRFDRARNRFNETRSLKDLFGASRTLAEFNNARQILEAQKKSGYESDFMNRPKSERNYTGPGGGDNTGGDIGAKGAADTFSNKSGMGRTGY